MVLRELPILFNNQGNFTYDVDTFFTNVLLENTIIYIKAIYLEHNFCEEIP